MMNGINDLAKWLEEVKTNHPDFVHFLAIGTNNTDCGYTFLNGSNEAMVLMFVQLMEQLCTEVPDFQNRVSKYIDELKRTQHGSSKTAH